MPFGRDDLAHLSGYARAIFAAATRGTPLPDHIRALWEPYHALFPGDGGERGPLATIYAGIGDGCAETFLPPVPLALDPAALFPQADVPASPRVDWGEVDGALARIEAANGAIADGDAIHGYEPLYFTAQRYGTNLPATIGAGGLSLFRQFALVSAVVAIGSGDAPAADALLVGGDTPGIQSFIGGGLTARHAAKRLRGRSLLLQLLTDAVARRLLDALGLPRANLLYAAGGNFLLLAPPGVEPRLEQIRDDVSSALLRYTDGDLDQALAWTPVSPPGIIGRDARRPLGVLRGALAAEKRRPYHGALAGDGSYNLLFGPASDRSATEPSEERDFLLADQLRDDTLGRHAYLHRVYAPHAAPPEWWRQLLHAVSGGWRYAVERSPRPADAPPTHLVDGINRVGAVPGDATGFRLVGATTPRDDDGSIRELQGIGAVTPMGRVGVLRMDVDDLGQIFGREMETIADVCTLSASLDLFFAGWLNHICEDVGRSGALAGSATDTPRGDLLYTIYSGGDDLFVIGAWDRLPVLAGRIHADFARYCGHHPSLHLSAGIAVEDDKFPIYQLADRAAAALDDAKALAGPPGRGDKRAVVLLDHRMPFEALDGVQALVGSLTPPRLGREPSALLGRLRDLALLDREERLRLGVGGADPFAPRNVYVGRALWRGLVALRRAREQYERSDPDVAGLLRGFEQQLIDESLSPHLALAVRWAEYLWRPAAG